MIINSQPPGWARFSLLALLLLPSVVLAQTLNSFANGEVADATAINENFEGLKSEFDHYLDLRTLRFTGTSANTEAAAVCQANEFAIAPVCSCSTSPTPAALEFCGVGFIPASSLFGGVARCIALDGQSTPVAQLEFYCVALPPTMAGSSGRVGDMVASPITGSIFSTIQPRSIPAEAPE